MENKNTLCVLPWNSVSVGVDGALSVCCNSNGAILIDGKAATVDNIEAAIHSPYMQKLREDLFNGVQNPICARCWKMEPNSFRTSTNKDHCATHTALVNSATLSDTTVKLEYVSMNVGNKCNLACRMCSPASSSLIEKEWYANTPPIALNAYNLNTSNRLSEMPTVLENKQFLDYLAAHGDSLTSVYLYGGEPMIIDEPHVNFLTMLIERGHAKHIKLQYSTNGTTTNLDKFSELWKEFNNVNMQISVDGFESSYDYIRWPMNWQKLSKNLQSYYELRDRGAISNLGICTTVQVTSIRDLNNLQRYVSTTFGCNCYFIPVDQPSIMSLKSVPLSELTRLLNTWDDSATYSMIESIAAPYINSYDDEASKLSFTRFVEASIWQDKFRKQNLYATYPYMADWFN